MKKIQLISSLFFALICLSNLKVALAQNNTNVGVIRKTSMSKSVFESTSLNSSRLSLIPTNTEFEVLEESQVGNFRWFKVSYQGETGWITDTGTAIEKKNNNRPQTQKQAPSPIKGNLSAGAALLFKDVKSRLSDEEKNSIFQMLEFSVSKDKQMFCMSVDEKREFPFSVNVFPTDLNKDGVEEIFIGYGNTFTSGITGSSTSLIIKGHSGKYIINYDTEGGLPESLNNAINGYPDILIPGRGFEYPVWRWNGSKYDYNRQVSDNQLSKMRTTSISVLSEAYQKKTNAAKPQPALSDNTENKNIVTEQRSINSYNTNKTISQKKPVAEVPYQTSVDSVAYPSAVVRVIGQIATAKRNIVLYDHPSFKLGEPLLIVQKNISFQIEETYSQWPENWYKVSINDISGWVSAENATLKNDGVSNTYNAGNTTATTKIPTYTIKKVSRQYDWPSKTTGKSVGAITADYEYPLFDDEQLNAALRKKFTEGVSFEKAADNYIAEQKQTYANYTDEMFGASGLGQGYDLKITVSRQLPDFTLLKATWGEDNEGAAHAQHGEIDVIYDTRAKKILQLDGILIAGGRNELRQIAEKIFRRDEKLNTTASLCNNYLFDNCKFELARNFTAHKGFLEFIYDPYEGKSFAAGIWSVKLNYASVKRLIKPEYQGLFD